MALILGRYRVEAEVGRGAMGVVYRAYDERLGRYVALKELVIQQHLTPELRDEMARRFEIEARAAGRLSHPNIVAIHDVISEDGRSYIVMEYLEGVTLDQLVISPLPADQAVSITMQILDAVGQAHANGVIHRDLKPENVFVLADGRVKVTDFGIAHVGETTSALTRVGTIIGTMGYMSPEQLRGEQVDGRADLFAVGTLLYEMLTGRNPFAADTQTAIMYRIAHEDPQSPRALRSGVPKYVEAVARKALHKDPARRYQTAAEMAFDLQQRRVPKVRAMTPVPLPKRGQRRGVRTGAGADESRPSAPTVIDKRGSAPTVIDQVAPTSAATADEMGVVAGRKDTATEASAPFAAAGVEKAGIGPAAVMSEEEEPSAAAFVDGAMPGDTDGDVGANDDSGHADGMPASDTEEMGRSRRKVLLVSLITAAAAAAAVLAAVVLVPSITSGNAVEVTAPAVLVKQARALDSQGAELQAAAASLVKAVDDLHSAAAKNETARKWWGMKWAKRQKDYQTDLAAVKRHNANEPAATPSHQESYQVWNAFSSRWETRSRTVPGTSPNLLPSPPRPKRPKKVKVNLKSVTAALRGAQDDLAAVSAALGKQQAAPELAATATALKAATKLAEEKVAAALDALSAMVSVDPPQGQKIDQAAAKSVDASGANAAVVAAKNALLRVRKKTLDVFLTKKQLKSIDFKWAVVSGPHPSISPSPSPSISGSP